ncbi:MAG: transposase [Solirubrobacteraceae bacterium]
MRVTTAFSRLLGLGKGVLVKKVRIERDRVVVEVALRRRRLVCPECAYSTAARKDIRPEDSVWRHLDLGVWRLEVHCRRRRLWCPVHGARTEGVPFARPRSAFTRDFECLVAWLATRTDKSTIKRMLRIDWDTVGRIIARVCDDELDPDRLNYLCDVGIDEVSWKRQHNYLTLVADHERRQVVWGCEGKGQAAADRFFDELDPPPDMSASPEPTLWAAEQPAIMVPFGPCTTVPAGRGIPGAWLHDGSELDRAIFTRASKLRAVSMDMTGGYAKSVRHNAPQATICIDPYHVVQLANQALDDVRRSYWNELRSLGDPDAAKRFKDARWSLLKKPEKLTDRQAVTLARIKTAGGEVWRAYILKEAVRGIFESGLSLDDVTHLIDRLLSRLARCRLAPFVKLGKTIRKHRDGILAATRLGINQGRTEALNNKVRLITRRAYGFHSAKAALALIMLTCGPITLHLPHELHALGTA